MSIKMEGLRCPYCGWEYDAAKSVTEEEVLPSEGDYSLCIRCGEIGIFEEGIIRKPSRREAKEMFKDKEIAIAKRAWANVQKELQERRRKLN